MATENLTAHARSTTGKGAARKLRAAKQIPGVIYGHHRDPQSITLDEKELERMLDRVSADTTVFEVKVGSTVARSLIREVQRHPLRRNILHIDFQELVAGEAVTVDVPVRLVGTPDGVRNQGGTLDQILRFIAVEVDPASIPNHFDLNVDALTLNQSLHVSDIVIPAGLKLLVELSATVCVVVPPRTETEVAPVVAAEGEAAAVAEPELIRKPKPEGDEAEDEGKKDDGKKKK